MLSVLTLYRQPGLCWNILSCPLSCLWRWCKNCCFCLWEIFVFSWRVCLLLLLSWLWLFFRSRWAGLSWTRSVSQALAPCGGASPARPRAGEGGPTKALGGNDRPGPDTTGAPLPLPIRGPVSAFFGQVCIGHGQLWNASAIPTFFIYFFFQAILA